MANRPWSSAENGRPTISYPAGISALATQYVMRLYEGASGVLPDTQDALYLLTELLYLGQRDVFSADSVLPAGTNQATATLITAPRTLVSNTNTGTGTLATGFRLPDPDTTGIRHMWVGFLENVAAPTTFSLYPATGDQIMALGTNNPLTVESNNWYEFDFKGGTWYCENTKQFE